MFKLIYPRFWQYKGWLSYLLWPLSKIYFLFGAIRQIIIKPIFLNAKVICVGNITIGGTGKTQIVIWLAKLLREKNISFVIITKGYRSKLNKPTLVTSSHTVVGVGDESVLLNNYGSVIAVKKPIQAIEVINTLKAQVIIMDDGMQNSSFYKDFTIMTIDGQRGIGNEYLIPSGPLREGLTKAFKKCDAVIIINSNKNITLEKKIQHYKKPLFKATITAINKDFDKTKNYYAFSGIGNPERFFNTLSSAALKIIATKIFPDHYNYSHNDINSLIINAKKYNAILITTAKDYVKIPKKFKNFDIICFDTELIIDNKNELINLISGAVFY